MTKTKNVVLFWHYTTAAGFQEWPFFQGGGDHDMRSNLLTCYKDFQKLEPEAPGVQSASSHCLHIISNSEQQYSRAHSITGAISLCIWANNAPLLSSASPQTIPFKP